MNKIDKAYENLAHAIVLQAVDDYRKALRGKRTFDGVIIFPEKVERFFLSKWFMHLTTIEGQTIINRLQKELLTERG